MPTTKPKSRTKTLGTGSNPLRDVTRHTQREQFNIKQMKQNAKAERPSKTIELSKAVMISVIVGETVLLVCMAAWT